MAHPSCILSGLSLAYGCLGINIFIGAAMYAKRRCEITAIKHGIDEAYNDQHRLHLLKKLGQVEISAETWVLSMVPVCGPYLALRTRARAAARA